MLFCFAALFCIGLARRYLSAIGDEAGASEAGAAAPRAPPLRGDLLWLSIRMQLQEEYERRAAAESEWRARCGMQPADEKAGAEEPAERYDEQLAMLEAQHTERHAFS